MKKVVIFFCYTLIMSLLIFPSYAFAYIDPGTISYAIQVIAAVVLTAGASIGIFWNQIKSFFKKNKDVEKSTDEIDKDEI